MFLSFNIPFEDEQVALEMWFCFVFIVESIDWWWFLTAILVRSGFAFWLFE